MAEQSEQAIETEYDSEFCFVFVPAGAEGGLKAWLRAKRRPTAEYSNGAASWTFDAALAGWLQKAVGKLAPGAKQVAKTRSNRPFFKI